MLPPAPANGASSAALSACARRDPRHRLPRHAAGAAVLALPLGFLAARNIMLPTAAALPLPPRAGHAARHRYADLGADLGQRRRARTLRRACWRSLTADFGTFGKLFSEAIESRRPQPAGGRRRRRRQPACTRVRFGVLPQVLPVMAEPGALLLRVQHPLGHHHRHRRRGRHRAASGRADPHAGMAGRVASSCCWSWSTVAAIDFISARLRMAIIGRRSTAPG